MYCAAHAGKGLCLGLWLAAARDACVAARTRRAVAPLLPHEQQRYAGVLARAFLLYSTLEMIGSEALP